MLTKLKKKYKEVVFVSLLLKGLFLHICTPVLGVVMFFIEKRLHRLSYPLIALVLYGITLALFQNSVESLLRLVQLLGIALLFSWGLLNRKFNFEDIAKAIIAIGVITLFYDIFNGTAIFQKPIVGFELPRYKGLLREYNFSAVAYLGALLLLLRSKKYWYHILALMLLISTGSRAGLVSFFLLTILLVVKNKKIEKIIIITTLLYPLFVVSTFFTSTEYVKKLNAVSSKRIAIQQASLRILEEKPFGVGYFQGRRALEEYKVKSALPYNSTEPHNLVMQIIFEFGIGAVLILIPALVYIIKFKGPLLELAVIMCMFSFLNGLHELFLYLIIIYSKDASESSFIATKRNLE